LAQQISKEWQTEGPDVFRAPIGVCWGDAGLQLYLDVWLWNSFVSIMKSRRMPFTRLPFTSSYSITFDGERVCGHIEMKGMHEVKK